MMSKLLMNEFGTPKHPERDVYWKLNNKTLRNLIVICRNLTKYPSQIDPDELDKIIIKCTHCAPRTAWNYREALLEMCFALGV